MILKAFSFALILCSTLLRRVNGGDGPGLCVSGVPDVNTSIKANYAEEDLGVYYIKSFYSSKRPDIWRNFTCANFVFSRDYSVDSGIQDSHYIVKMRRFNKRRGRYITEVIPYKRDPMDDRNLVSNLPEIDNPEDKVYLRTIDFNDFYLIQYGWHKLKDDSRNCTYWWHISSKTLGLSWNYHEMALRALREKGFETKRHTNHSCFAQNAWF